MMRQTPNPPHAKPRPDPTPLQMKTHHCRVAGPEYKAQPYWLDSKTAPPEGKEPEGTVHARPVYYKRLRVLNPRGILAMVLYTAALGFYIWIRVTKTLGLAQYTCARCAASVCGNSAGWPLQGLAAAVCWGPIRACGKPVAVMS